MGGGSGGRVPPPALTTRMRTGEDRRASSEEERDALERGRSEPRRQSRPTLLRIALPGVPRNEPPEGHPTPVYDALPGVPRNVLLRGTERSASWIYTTHINSLSGRESSIIAIPPPRGARLTHLILAVRAVDKFMPGPLTTREREAPSCSRRSRPRHRSPSRRLQPCCISRRTDSWWQWFCR